MDGEIDVDEEISVEVELAADAVAEVRRDKRALERGRFFAVEQRRAQPAPTARRADSFELARSEAPLHGGPEPDPVHTRPPLMPGLRGCHRSRRLDQRRTAVRGPSSPGRSARDE